MNMLMAGGYVVGVKGRDWRTHGNGADVVGVGVEAEGCNVFTVGGLSRTVGSQRQVWAGRGSPGLGAWWHPIHLAYGPFMFPQGTKQPNFGGEQLVVGELEQQLLAWWEKDKGGLGGIQARKATHAPPGRAPPSRKLW